MTAEHTARAPSTLRRRWRLAAALAGLAALALLVACNRESRSSDAQLEDGARDNVGGSVDERMFEMIDVDYLLKEMDATVGEEKSFTITNNGGSPHTFTVERMPVENVTPESSTRVEGSSLEVELVEEAADATVMFIVDGSQEVDVSFTPTEAGEYTYYCAIPGHRETGMEGTLTVEEAS